MAVAIRLARHGAKKNPYYHIIAINSREARDSGRVLETLGKYDPMQPKESDKRVTLKIDRIKDWMAKGAKPSDRVYKFLANAGLVTPKAHPTQTKAHLPSEKTMMKLKDRADRLAKAAEAAASASAATAEASATVETTIETDVETVETTTEPIAEPTA